MTRAGASFCVAFLFSLPAFAHKASDAYLALSVQGARVDAQWDIALRDLAEPVGADLDGDGRITWGELRGREQALAAWALSRLDVAADGRPCLAGPSQLLVDSHSDGAYAVLRFSLQCPAEPAALAVGYRLLFDTDAQHRGLLRLEARGETRTAVFGPATSEQRFDLAATRPLAQMATFVREGVHHIWSGFDHLLFLIALLLPAVLRRQDGRWVPVASFRPALQDAAKVVTAFTVAHSLTLTLAALDVVRLPSRLVEAGIARSRSRWPPSTTCVRSFSACTRAAGRSPSPLASCTDSASPARSSTWRFRARAWSARSSASISVSSSGSSRSCSHSFNSLMRCAITGPTNGWRCRRGRPRSPCSHSSGSSSGPPGSRSSVWPDGMIQLATDKTAPARRKSPS